MRIRTLKPEWLTDEKMEAEDDSTRLLSAGLILLADDHGRGRAAAAQIAGTVWPSHLERDPAGTMRKTREGLARLSTMGFLTLYEVRGQSYFEIRNWARHQKVDKPSKPRVPAPCETLAEHSRAFRETLAPDPDLRSPISDHEHRPACAREEPAQATPAQIDRAVADALSEVRAAHGPAPVSEAQKRIDALDHFALVERLFGVLRRKHGGSTWRRSHADYLPLQSVAEWVQHVADVEGADPKEIVGESLTGYAADAWAKKAGYPLSAWAKDPGKYRDASARVDLEES